MAQNEAAECSGGVLSGLVSGSLAGVVGLLAMDLLWYRRSGGDDGFVAYEFSTDAQNFDDVGASAQVARRVARAVGVELPERSAGVANDLVHWMTGVGWGAAAGVLATRRGPFVSGILSGGFAFVASYVVLAPFGIYDPPWEYDAETLWKDLSAHLVFGAGAGVALAGAQGLASRC